MNVFKKYGNKIQEKLIASFSKIGLMVTALVVVAITFTACNREDDIIPTKKNKQEERVMVLFRGKLTSYDELKKTIDTDKLILLVENEKLLRAFESEKELVDFAPSSRYAAQLLKLPQRINSERTKTMARTQGKTKEQLRSQAEQQLRSVRTEREYLILADQFGFVGFQLWVPEGYIIEDLSWYYTCWASTYDCFNWNDKARSARNETSRLTVCFQLAYFSGPYLILPPDSYIPVLASQGFDRNISSVLF